MVAVSEQSHISSSLRFRPYQRENLVLVDTKWMHDLLKCCYLYLLKHMIRWKSHCATNNWMIDIGDEKARGHRMMTNKIIELDQLLIPFSQMTKKEAERFMKKTKFNNKGWITL